MLKYEYLNKTDAGFEFAYYPEGNKTAPGKVVVTENGSGVVIEESPDDFGKRYAYHAIKGIDTTRKSGTVAWY